MKLISKSVLVLALTSLCAPFAYSDNWNSKALNTRQIFKKKPSFQATRKTMVKINIANLHKVDAESGALISQGSVEIETMKDLQLTVGELLYFQNGQVFGADVAEQMNDTTPYCTIRSDEESLTIPARSRLEITGATEDNYWSTWLPWNWGDPRYTSEIFLSRYWNPDVYQMVSHFRGYQLSVECGKDRPEGSNYDQMNFQDFEKAVSPSMKIISINLPK